MELSFMSAGILVRYGVMGFIGRFEFDNGEFPRGEKIVVESRRGRELGEVVAILRSSAADSAIGRVLHRASTEDLAQFQVKRNDRQRRLAACEEVFREGHWPLELLDVEALLDGERTVLYYLGPHHLDVAGLTEILRVQHGLEVYFEPTGRDEPDQQAESAITDGCDTCDSEGGCGESGCGKQDGKKSGCGSCAVKDLVGRRNSVPAH
jgi:cell fate regulator YaaT (PSP1 superfamily)